MRSRPLIVRSVVLRYFNNRWCFSVWFGCGPLGTLYSFLSLELPVLAPTLLGCAGRLLLVDLLDYLRAALVAIEMVVDFSGQPLARVLAILLPRARLLAVDNYARGYMLELDGDA